MIKGTTMACYYGFEDRQRPGLPVSSACALLSVRMKNQAGATWLLFQTCRTSYDGFWLLTDRIGIINGKRKHHWSTFILEMTTQGSAHLHSFTGGLRIENMVPESRLQSFWTTTRSCWPLRCCQEHQLKYEISTVDEETYTVTIVGKSAHGSTREDGINGATYWLSC